MKKLVLDPGALRVESFTPMQVPRALASDTYETMGLTCSCFRPACGPFGTTTPAAA